MGLVDYSDSDTSDTEEKAAAEPVSISKPFQKVVDRSNPGKIKISLPQATKEDAISDEPPTKRTKLEGGGTIGFMASLPAPKRTGQAMTKMSGGSNTRKGLGSDVNLKTEASPMFCRESEKQSESRDYDDAESEVTNAGFGMSLPPPKAVANRNARPAEAVKLVGKPMLFKPLSVTRKAAKKKKVVAAFAPAAALATASAPSTPKNDKQPARPKVSMFSLSSETSVSASNPINGEYMPMIYEVPDEIEEPEESLEASFEEYTPNASFAAPPAVPTPPTSQSLQAIARDLNLSNAEERQLFGRGQKGGRATKIINFNTDQEYLHNEQLRANGEQMAYNPVRAIAPGKHSLKQLVSNAQSQKEALEESFAKGKSNRAEASSRYGW